MELPRRKLGESTGVSPGDQPAQEGSGCMLWGFLISYPICHPGEVQHKVVFQLENFLREVGGRDRQSASLLAVPI